MSDAYAGAGVATAPPSPNASEPLRAPTALDELRTDLAAKVGRPPVVVSPLLRPLYRLHCNANIREPVLEQWRRASKDGTRERGVDVVRFAGIVLSHTCEKITRDGVVLTTDGGQPLRLDSEEFMALTGTVTTPAAVLALFGGDDPDLITAAGDVLTGAGYAPGAALGADPT